MQLLFALIMEEKGAANVFLVSQEENCSEVIGKDYFG